MNLPRHSISTAVNSTWEMKSLAGLSMVTRNQVIRTPIAWNWPSGSPVTLAVYPETKAAVRLFVLDDQGTARARGVTLPRGGEVIRDFLPPKAGSYVVVLESDEPSELQLGCDAQRGSGPVA